MSGPCEHGSMENMDGLVSKVVPELGKNSIENSMRMVSESIAETFGTESTSAELSSTLRNLFPHAEFVRASLRFESGLFVTDNLLNYGRCMINLVSLKNSLSVECMDHGDLVVFRVPEAAYGSEQTGCSRSSIGAIPAMAHGEPMGTLIVGVPGGGLDEASVDAMRTLAESLGEVLESAGQRHMSHLCDLLALREQDSEFFGAEESLQDLPVNVSIPFRGFGAAQDSQSESQIPFPEGHDDEPTGKDQNELYIPASEGHDDEPTGGDQNELYIPASEGPEDEPSRGDQNESQHDNDQINKIYKSDSYSSDREMWYNQDKGASTMHDECGYTKQKQMVPLPHAMGVRVFGISLIYISAMFLLMVMRPIENKFGLASLIPMVASLLSFGSSGMALAGPKKNWFAANADVFLAVFCVLNFLLSTMNAFSIDNNVVSLKRSLLQAMVVFESSLLLCLARRPVAYGAHVAACVSLSAAMLLNA